MSRASDFEGDGGVTDIYPDRANETAYRESIVVSAGPITKDVGARAVVGSSAGADVVLADPTVSRLHAELELAADGIWLRDLGSTNGTFVGDVRIERARLPDGAVIRLGATKISVGRTPKNAPVDLWPTESFGPLLGRSQQMRELFAKLHRFA